MLRKTNLFLFVCTLCIAFPSNALDLAALEGMLSNDSLFDGGGGDMWGGGGWDDFGSDSGGSWATYHSRGDGYKVEKKEAPKMEEVGSDKERFLQDMPDGTEKLPKKHKEVAREYLSTLVQEIRGLHTELTSMKLSISLQETLRKTAEAIPPALEKIELISSKSSYLLTLFRKEFNGLRKKIISTTTDAVKARGAFTDMPAPSADSNDFFASPAPSSRQKRAQEDAKKKTERLVSGPLKRLLADIEKVISHASTKRSLEAKKKDHTAPKDSANTQDNWGGEGFGGGWGDDAGFGVDAWGGDGFGGGWGGDSDFFGGGDFGGGGDWGMGDFGGGDWGGGWGDSDWGGSSSSGGGDWGGTSSDTAADSSSGSNTVYGETPKTKSEDKSDESPLLGGGLRHEDPGSMRGDQRTERLAKKCTLLLKKWNDKLKAADDASGKQKVLRAMLIDKTFIESQRGLNEAVEILTSGEQLASESATRALDGFDQQLLESSPLIIHGVKYTIPLLGNEQEARELYAAQDATAEKKSLDEARKAVAKRVRVRQLAEKFMTNVLNTILRTGNKKLQNKMDEELRQYETSGLNQVEALSKKLTDGPLSLGESGNLLLASRGVLSRPTSQDMAQILHSGAGREELMARVSQIRETLLKKIKPHVTLFSTLYTIMGDVLPSGISKKTDAGMAELSATAEARIKDSTLSNDEKKQARGLLLPFSVGLWNKNKALMLAHLKTQEAWERMGAADAAGDTPMGDMAGLLPAGMELPGAGMPEGPAAAAGETPRPGPAAAPEGQAQRMNRIEQLVQKFSVAGGEASEAAAPVGEEVSGAPQGGAVQPDMLASITSNPKALEIAEKMQRGELSQEEAAAQLQGLI